MLEGFREAGIVEKLLPSYGFIQCCERQARLFFHYSQFKGNIDHLKLGDPVEFEMTYDRRTGKPIASMVVKISSEAFLGEELSSERVSGFITTELGEGREGRVAYEHRGECFFLPFTTKDLEDSSQLVKQNDRVTFLITPDKSGNLRARRIALETPTPECYQGVVCTLKDSFGFIERADLVKEIFFHSSECKDFKSLTLGDDVEFKVQTRNNKEVAVSVDKLPSGTVVFEDVSSETNTGRIVKLLDRHNNHSSSRQHFTSNSLQSGSSSSEPFPGKIVYMDGNTEKEISFGEKDIRGDYTLQVGDTVQFNIVTDRRDKLEHATHIVILDETFENSEESREQGYIAAVKGSYGFIKCLNREGTRMFFRFAELLDPSIIPKLNEEVIFTIAPDHSMPGRLQAVRIKFLPDGTIFKNLYAKPNFGNIDSSEGGKMSTSYGGSKLESRLRNGYGNNTDSDDDNGNCEFPLIDFNSDEPSTKGKSSLSSSDYLSKSAEPRFGKTQNSWSHILSQLPISMTSDPSTMENGHHHYPPTPHTTTTSSSSNDNSQLNALFSSVDDTSTSSPSMKPLEPSSMKNSSFPNENNCNDNDPTKYNKLFGDNQNGLLENGFNGKNGVKSTQRGGHAAVKESFGYIENENHKNESFFHFSDATDTPRPERLITRLKSMVVDENVGPKMVTVRQPKGPDGSKGFSVSRQGGSSSTATSTTTLTTNTITATTTSSSSTVTTKQKKI